MKWHNKSEHIFEKFRQFHIIKNCSLIFLSIGMNVTGQRIRACWKWMSILLCSKKSKNGNFWFLCLTNDFVFIDGYDFFQGQKRWDMIACHKIFQSHAQNERQRGGAVQKVLLSSIKWWSVGVYGKHNIHVQCMKSAGKWCK